MFSLFASPSRACTSAASVSAAGGLPTTIPHYDIRDTGGDLQIVADMPGVSVDGVEISVRDDVLTVRGTSRAQEPEALPALWRSFVPRNYARSFRLGQAIDTDRIAATAKDGIVRVILPRRTSAQAKTIVVSPG